MSGHLLSIKEKIKLILIVNINIVEWERSKGKVFKIILISS